MVCGDSERSRRIGAHAQPLLEVIRCPRAIILCISRMALFTGVLLGLYRATNILAPPLSAFSHETSFHALVPDVVYVRRLRSELHTVAGQARPTLSSRGFIVRHTAPKRCAWRNSLSSQAHQVSFAVVQAMQQNSLVLLHTSGGCVQRAGSCQ